MSTYILPLGVAAFAGICYLGGLLFGKAKRGAVPDLVYIGPDDAGKDILLPVNARLCASLTAIPSAGYLWELAYTDNAMLPQFGKPEMITPPTQAVGGAGKSVWWFVGMRPGTVKLKLRNRRPWEPVGTDPYETEYSVNIVIQ